MSIFYHEQQQRNFYSADILRQRDEIKRDQFDLNNHLKGQMAQLEADFHDIHLSRGHLRRPILELLESTLMLTETLNLLTDNKYQDLYPVHQRIESGVRLCLSPLGKSHDQPMGLSLAACSPSESALIGGKALNLSRLAFVLPKNVLPGFVISTAAYRLILESEELANGIHSLLTDLDVITDRELFRSRTSDVRKLIEETPVPERISTEIVAQLERFPIPDVRRWAVRSSGVGEDEQKAFAGQYDSLLNVPANELAPAYLKVVASHFTDRAVCYRLARSLSEESTAMAVLFLPMIDARSAGVLYSRDPSDSSADRMLLNSVWGLAADLLGGRAESDTFVVSRSEPRRILKQQVANKPSLAVLGEEGGIKTISLNAGKHTAPSLKEDEIAELVRLGLVIEEHFGIPQDIEWVVDQQGTIWIVQSRRLLFQEWRKSARRESAQGDLLLTGGVTIFPGWTTGHVMTLQKDVAFLGVSRGRILVVKEVRPEIIGLLPNLSGLIAEQDDPSGQVAARVQELGLPCLFGIKDATAELQEGMNIVLDGALKKVFSAPSAAKERDFGKEKRDYSWDPTDPFYELIFKLNVTDPGRVSDPNECRSLNDLIGFVHHKFVECDAPPRRQRS